MPRSARLDFQLSFIPQRKSVRSWDTLSRFRTSDGDGVIRFMPSTRSSDRPCEIPRRLARRTGRLRNWPRYLQSVTVTKICWRSVPAITDPPKLRRAASIHICSVTSGSSAGSSPTTTHAEGRSFVRCRSASGRNELGLAQTPPLFTKSPFHRVGVRMNKKAETVRDRRVSTSTVQTCLRRVDQGAAVNESTNE
jgi:hypothetical protein